MHPILILLGPAGHGGAGEPGVWYARWEGQITNPSHPAASHARVALQVRPTIAVEERPREALPVVTEEAERRWAQAHLNDYLVE